MRVIAFPVRGRNRSESRACRIEEFSDPNHTLNTLVKFPNPTPMTVPKIRDAFFSMILTNSTHFSRDSDGDLMMIKLELAITLNQNTLALSDSLIPLKIYTQTFAIFSTFISE